MSIVNEFKEFISKGSALDLAVGVIIGAAFSAIVNSLVNDIIMPIISLFGGGKTDFTNLFITTDGIYYNTLAEAKAAGTTVIAYGSFITAIINFLLIALVIFLFVKFINKLRMPKKAVETTPAPPQPSNTELLLSEIRDILKLK